YQIIILLNLVVIYQIIEYPNTFSLFKLIMVQKPLSKTFFILYGNWRLHPYRLPPSKFTLYLLSFVCFRRLTYSSISTSNGCCINSSSNLEIARIDIPSSTRIYPYSFKKSLSCLRLLYASLYWFNASL